MGLAYRMRRDLAAMIPGTRANIAKQRHQMEKDLRAAGHSKKEAATMVALHFRGKNGG